jgi:hypothetical protein
VSKADLGAVYTCNFAYESLIDSVYHFLLKVVSSLIFYGFFPEMFLVFFNAFILWNNSGRDKLMNTLRCGIPLPTRTQATRCGNTFAFVCFDFRVRLGTDSLTSPEVSTDYLLLQFFYPAIQCNCSACNVPPDAGLQKRATFPH